MSRTSGKLGPMTQTVFVDPKKSTSLWAFLVKHKLSQKEFSERLGVPCSTVSGWINNQVKPSVYRLIQVYYVTNGEIKITDFLDRDEKVALAKITNIEVEDLI